MRKETGGQVPPLERPARTRAWWLRRLAPLLLIAGVGTVFTDVVFCRGGSPPEAIRAARGSDCAVAVQDELTSAWQICQAAYYGGGADHATGVFMAKALHKRADAAADAEATWVAKQLLSTEVRSDALQVLGQIARDARRNEEAAKWLEPARQLHLKQNRPGEVARDDAMLALALTDLGRFTEALTLLDEAIKQSERDGGTGLQRYCHLTAAKTLIRIGYWSEAEKELDIAQKFTHTGHEQVSLDYQRASLEQEKDHHAYASSLFKNALQPTTPPATSSWILKTQLNLAYSLAAKGFTGQAQDHLNEATLLDADGELQQVRLWVEALIAYRDGALPRASALIDKYLKLVTDDDSIDASGQLDMATLQARIGLDSGDLAGAERAASRGVELAEKVRSAQPLKLRAWALSKRRLPYELLFLARARLDHADDAAMAFDAWQGRTMLDALARSQPSGSLDYATMADQVEQLSQWMPVVPQTAVARIKAQAAVVQTMRNIDLLALIVADGQVWRLMANHGPPQLSKIVALEDIQGRLEDFYERATDPTLAAELGARLVPNEAFRETQDALYVVIDGQLGKLPVAALRHGKTPLIAMRPVAHMLRLPEAPCVDVARAGQATVLGVRDKNAPTAQAEAKEVSRLLHKTLGISAVTTAIGAEATKNALFAAANSSVLHVASHGKVAPGGASLVLADDSVSALEISARRVAPSLAVLAACATAMSDDPERAGSLVAGFLGAGSQHVVATLRTVLDAGAHEVATRFYLAGGVADPERALQKVQADLVNTGNIDWPYFAVFGPDICHAAEHP